MDIIDVPSTIKILNEKKEFLNEMLLLTEEYKEALKDEKIERLEGILDKKDSVIEKINDIDFKLKNCNLEEQMKDKDLFNILSEIKEVLKKIKTLDDENNKNLSKAMIEMKGSLKETRESRRVMNKYGNSDPYQAFATQGGTLFIDQDS